MESSTTPSSKILHLTLTLSNYPILAKKIRARMRQELFAKGILDPNDLETEVEKRAIATQRVEGIEDPLNQESEDVWQERIARVRDYLTDFYFSYNLPFSRFEAIVEGAVNENRAGLPGKTVRTFINPELAPWYILLEEGEKYANYPPELYESVKHHLRQIIVVLLKGLVSDQLAFVHIARKFIGVFDLKNIKARKIGTGKIGGKAAGMYLAYSIISQPHDDDAVNLSDFVTIPETYFIGSDVYYDFKAINNLQFTTSLKYRTREEIEREYPRIREAYLSSHFPDYTVEKLRELLIRLGDAPLIVRSSSLLEDNFGSAFAGKYDSFFLPNQGSLEENLSAILQAVANVYASVLSPDALFYRQIQGLDDYDERMAILIQKVQGERFGNYFFPHIAGVGFSRNPFIWNKKLRREEGFLRIVLGLGSRAVERVDQDYPRMIGLSHPQLRPVKGAEEIKKYSQRFMDVINLEQNRFESIPITDVISTNFPGIQYLAAVDEGDYVKPMFSLGKTIPPERLILTFDNLLKNTDFVELMKTMLKKLEQHYERPVDVEFTVQLIPDYPRPSFKISLLQCRPLSNQAWDPDIVVPNNVSAADQVFSANHLVPQGIVDRINYIVYVDPVAYNRISSSSTRMQLARVIGRLNRRLSGESFILMGPGRWGSSNLDLGVKVTYADIYNTHMLIEIALTRNGVTPEVSYGTHFFQDLVESKIYPLSLYPDKSDVIFNQQFFKEAPNCLASLVPADSIYADYIKVINVPQASHGRLLRVVMNAEESKALAYLYGY